MLETAEDMQIQYPGDIEIQDCSMKQATEEVQREAELNEQIEKDVEPTVAPPKQFNPFGMGGPRGPNPLNLRPSRPLPPRSRAPSPVVVPHQLRPRGPIRPRGPNPGPMFGSEVSNELAKKLEFRLQRESQ